MLLTLLLPIVIYVVSQAAGQDMKQATSGVDTHIEIEKEQDSEDGPATTTPTPLYTSSQDASSGSSVIVDEGESSVQINIENNTGENDSFDASPSLSLPDFQYPGARIAESTPSQMRLVTSDGSDSVTDWYESVISGKDMNVQSFVRTNTNGTVLNKLAAAGGGQEVVVEISSQNEGGETTIVVQSE